MLLISKKTAHSN